jgi:5-methylcytosine-specific restriction enzyme A
MPWAVKVRCRGCGTPVARGYCDACQAKGRSREIRPNSAQRGYGSRWRKASAGWLAAHPLCVDPFGVHGGVPVQATDVDHKVPSRGDMNLHWQSDNWQSLCKSCHSRKTAAEDGGFGRSPINPPGIPALCGEGIGGLNSSGPSALDRI